MLSMIAVQRGVIKRVSAWQNVDIGCLAHSYSYAMLVVTTLPRVKMMLAAFYTVGCEFEGSQRAFSDSWFVMYRAIVNIAFLHSSIVNVLARIFRRRMSSVHIPVSIMLLSLMHWLQAQIGASRWFGFDGRVSTLVSRDEFESMSLLQVLMPSTGLRLNGNVRVLFMLKMIALSLNTITLVFSQSMSVSTKRSRSHVSCPSEKSLCVLACNVGGLGRSDLYEWVHNCNAGSRQMLHSYELVRLGYIVVGDRYLMTWGSWIGFALVCSLNRLSRWRTHRLMVFEVISNEDRLVTISSHPLLINLSDPKLLGLKWWDIDSRALF